MDQEQAGASALAALTEAQRQQAMARFAVLRSHLHEGIPLSEVARTAGVPLRSVQRWLARYRAAGLVGLARAQRSDTGQRKLPADLVQVIEGMALAHVIGHLADIVAVIEGGHAPPVELEHRLHMSAHRSLGGRVSWTAWSRGRKQIRLEHFNPKQFAPAFVFFAVA